MVLFRQIISMTMFVSFIVVILNSIVLYIVPEGRVAYWADWTFLGLTKSQWGQQHTTVGFLFLAAGLIHTYFNWRRIVSYLQNKMRQTTFRTKPFAAAFLVTLFFVVGTYYQVPPMSSIVQLSEHFKHSAAEQYGEPPYGHAESSSLQMFAKKEQLDLNQAVQLLKQNNIKVNSPKQTLKELALAHQLSPQDIYLIIKPASKTEVNSEGKQTFPDSPKSGWGKKTLTEVCELYGLPLNKIIKKLDKKGISASPDQQIKEIAEANDLEPMGVFEVLHSIVYAD